MPHVNLTSANDEVIVGDDLSEAGAYGPYHLIVDSVGGKTLESALPLLATGGTCVTLGWTASPSVTMDVSKFIRTGRTTLYGLGMYAELDSRARSEDLAWLAQLVAEQRLRERQFTGKAVLHLA